MLNKRTIYSCWNLVIWGFFFFFFYWIYFEWPDQTYLKHSGTHMVIRVFFSFFSFRKRTLAIAQACCLQRTMPLTAFFASWQEDKSCSSSTRLPGSFVLSRCNCPQIPLSIKHKIGNLWSAILGVRYLDFSIIIFLPNGIRVHGLGQRYK